MTPQIPVGEFFDVIFPTFSPPESRVLAVLLTTLYLDESHDPPMEDYYAVAGFLANQHQWLAAMRKWEALLDKYELAYFRAADCETLVHHFAKFRDNPDDVTKPLNAQEKARGTEIKKSFVDAIVESELIGFGAAMDLHDLDSVKYRDADSFSILQDHPYLICATFAMTAAGYCTTRMNHERGADMILSFVFDQNKEVSGKFAEFYQGVAKQNPYDCECWGSWTFTCKEKYKPLQTADLLAYEVGKVLLNSVKNPTLSTRKALRRMNDGVQCLQTGQNHA